VPLPGGPLHLRARHEGERLSFQVNDLPPLEFQDVFPIGSSEKGAFAVLWPPGAGLGRLRGSRRTTPGEPSLLERGDMLYARGQFAEALLDYQAQAPVASDPKIAQEARCKEGLCLMGLGRYEDAEKPLEQLAASPGERWPVVAACQLWLLRLRHNDL